ncbi:MAG: MAE_28990/MAE_18760 family HEPN-like nuclease [Bacteroidales bacterium]
MYTNISITSAQRITEVREYLDFLAQHIPPAPTATPRYLNTCKGLIFVQLYGIIEFTINSTLTRTIDLINQELVKLQDTQPFIWSMALNPQLDALREANRKKWDKRFDLFQKVLDNDEVIITNDIKPTNGDNYNFPQLESIWKTFNITAPIFNDVTFRGRLQEIVSNRINISHGNNSAAEIGSNVTPADLYIRIKDVSRYCSYFISVFEDYILQKGFRK